MQDRIAEQCCGEMELQKRSYDVQQSLKDLVMVQATCGWQKLGSGGVWIKQREGGMMINNLPT
jgi:hypothetical protein